MNTGHRISEFWGYGAGSLAPFQVGTANPTVSAWKWVESGGVLPVNCIPETGSRMLDLVRTYYWPMLDTTSILVSAVESL